MRLPDQNRTKHDDGCVVNEFASFFSNSAVGPDKLASCRSKSAGTGLAVVIVGEDPASQVYVRNKKRRAEGCGFHSVQHTLDAGTPEADVLALIDELNNDDKIHGILVQLPLPDHLDEQTITQSISPGKDVDGFHLINVGRLWTGADSLVLAFAELHLTTLTITVVRTPANSIDR